MVQRMVDGDEGGSAGLVLVSTLRRGIRREQYQQQDLDKVIKTSVVVCVCVCVCESVQRTVTAVDNTVCT